MLRLYVISVSSQSLNKDEMPNPTFFDQTMIEFGLRPNLLYIKMFFDNVNYSYMFYSN